MMFKRRLLIAIAILLGTSLSGFAQSTVTGTVTDADDGQPMPGVNIIIKGSPTIGTSAANDGTYSITVPSAEEDTLVFSFVGYVKKRNSD